MTIRDMVEQIEMQGAVVVQYCDDKKVEEVNLFRSLEPNDHIRFPERLMDLEINYMWARTELDAKGKKEVPVIVIEVEVR